ncbi:MAG: glycerol-3-phosphate dehydrogenase [Aestuariivirga sp.]|uniref:glycerol-3-phosphate dehydrogenase n=1 Tax=Aestuariivirga sp. TaxID=2650926 RepID=UPI0025C17008|nr:glycerol-3-phosphate dehydrogenase [Aestuariivirga sp.]MCA3561184.1 glycerol-3-phosphate dehydrogenase [Aestuariivirga sp.]
MQELKPVDLVVIGGGVNGAGIARDAAGRGLSVILCEKDDLAQGTSSRSGKLIHGGLRYLEYYEFRLVREALIEREVLLNAAPHIVWPMRFVLPHSPEQRPAWLVRLGLFLYDHLGGRRKLPGCRNIDLRRGPEGKPIRPEFTRAFEYSDCWVDDARLVSLNALDAKERGAMVMTRTAATAARREDGAWEVEFTASDGTQSKVRAKAIANAAGPWVETVINGVAGSNSPRRVRLVKGSHIIVRKFWEGPQAYLFQNDDKRVIFVNPYEGGMALIGTTDIPYEGRAEDVAIDEKETDYLLAAINRYLKAPVTRDQVIHAISGVRPLYDDNAENPSAVTRDYVFDVTGEPPMLSVFGGKITTYRKLAEHALEKLKPFFPAMKDAWTATAPLPGGDMPDADFERFLGDLRKANPWLPEKVAHHYARLYGTRTKELLNGARGMPGLGQHFGGLLYKAEIDYLRRAEWARTADDVLDRRTKHGLHITAEQRAAVQSYMGG